MKVIYHKNCPDGFTAAWAAYLKYPDAEFIPAAYGDKPPQVSVGEEVYIVDFSYPLEDLVAMRVYGAYVSVIDHHKTAEADLKHAYVHGIRTTFDMNHSGAALAWLYFHGPNPPALVKYVEDRDLWKFELPDSREISAWIFSYDYDFKTWTSMSSKLNTHGTEVAQEGQAILRARMRDVRAMADQVQFSDMFQHAATLEYGKIPVTNATIHMSDVAEELQRRYPDAPFTGYYMDRGDGKRQWGLRSKGDMDVSRIAKGFGGGGHKNAAGFQEKLG